MVDDDHLGNFCRWLGLSGEEDVGNRALRLHVLTINNLGTGPNVFGVTSGYLRELLPCSRNLKSLTLHGLIEYVITPGQLRSALQALPSLEYIDLANITAQYKDIFADALCTPRSVSLSFVPNPHHHPRLTKEILVDIFPFLCHPSLQGIESLTIKAARLDAYSVSFPALRRLEADSCWLREVHADALAGSFPSLQYLYLSSIYFPTTTVPDAVIGMPLSEMHDGRNFAGRWRGLQGMQRAMLEQATWPSLQILRVGTVLEWYALHMACPVACVQLWTPGAQRCPEEISQALADSRPRCLGSSLRATTRLVLAMSLSKTPHIDFRKLGDGLNGTSISYLLVQIQWPIRQQTAATVWRQTVLSAQAFINCHSTPPALQRFWVESYQLGRLVGWTLEAGGTWKESSNESLAVIAEEGVDRMWT
ncbi:hypothetical protein BD310DRAFT_1043587 [Dichomitus squalens]|uniref:F-box domain-containing protein n=2 Tax=Dichomitus squalens TaxID=114155 RepID=A0A4Q9P9K5_9APHY|nr:hypothetical protein BD310DRAFT_1043587 [Dichomitus squalens]